MAPRGGRQLTGVVVGAALLELGAVGREVVPLLAGDLARLAAGAHRGVGEEAHPPRPVAVDGELGGGRHGRAHDLASCGLSASGSSWSGGTRAPCDLSPFKRSVDGPRRRPARTLQVNALDSWIEV